ncbi:MAG: choice-of-anchor T family protein [Thermoplasmata archaeon]
MGLMARSAPPFFTGAVLLVALLLGLPGGEARTPEVQVEIPQPEVKIDASVPSPMTASFSGTVHIKGNEFQTADVGLELDTGGWPGTITPSSRTVTGNTSLSFSALVTAPLEAEEGDYPVRVLARAESHGSPPALAQGIVTVTVVRNRVRVSCDETQKESYPGETVSFRIKLLNYGSTPDTFTQSVEEKPPLLRGISFRVDKGEVEVAPGESAYLNVEVALPRDAHPGSYVVILTVQSSESYNSFRGLPLTIVVKDKTSPMPAGSVPDLWLLAGVPLLLVCVCLVAFIGGTEVGLLAFVQLVLVPLFVRIKREKVLDRFTRGQIFGFIRANPGAHYLAIQEHLELENGVLAYHLKVLEREDYIVSVRDGIYKRFYPRHMKIPRRERELTRIQQDILSALKNNPGTSQSGLARMLGESKQVIAYHIRVLSRAGLVRVEREGQLTRCFVSGVEGERPPKTEEEAPAEIPELIRDIKA